MTVGSPENRKKYLLARLITENEYLNLYDLADEIYISPSSLRKDLKELKPTLERYHLTLQHSHSNGYRITGKEKDIRRCLSKEASISGIIDFLPQETSYKSKQLSLIQHVIAESLMNANHFDHRRFLQRAVRAYSDRDQPRGNQQYHQSGSQRSHAAVAGIQNSD